MRSNRAALASWSVFTWGTFSLCLFAAPANLTPADDPAGHTAELIRLHHETIALLSSMPLGEQKIEPRTCEQLPETPPLNGAESSTREQEPDTSVMRPAGGRSKRTEV